MQFPLEMYFDKNDTCILLLEKIDTQKGQARAGKISLYRHVYNYDVYMRMSLLF